jgi:uncharacterized protein (TIGR02145 family)
VNALGNPLVANLRALSSGDVNGTYNPQPTAPTLVLDTVVITGFGSGTATVRFTSSGSGVFERGICWGTSPNPTVSGNKVVVGSGGYGFAQVFSGSFVGNQLHYARAYARNSSGIFYSNEKTFMSPPGQPCPGVSTVTDIDGNVYQGILIGTQCWTQSNLKVSKYRNGDSILPSVGISPQGQFSIYNNDPVNDSIYGKLYNYYAVTDSRGLCPTGWKVPTLSDWKIMGKYLEPNSDTSWYLTLGNSGSGAVRSALMQPSPGGWATNLGNPLVTNSTGFSGLPGGEELRVGYLGFQGLTLFGGWWTSTMYPHPSLGYAWSVEHNGILRSDWEDMVKGYSIRCLRDSSSLLIVSTDNASAITSFSANIEGRVNSFGGTPITEIGIVYRENNSSNLTRVISNNMTSNGAFIDTLIGLSASTHYSVRAYATNFAGSIYGNEVTFTTLPIESCNNVPSVNDIDGNIYNTVRIGNQCWMQSNLRVSKFRNGDVIQNNLSNAAWDNATTGAYAIYNNDTVYDGMFGKLYNQFAVIDPRGLCPTGWHVPSGQEWKVLIKYLDPRTDTNTTLNSYVVQSRAGGSLKATVTQPNTSGWTLPNTGAVNSSGFTGLAGGRRYLGYNDIYNAGCWWSSFNSSMNSIAFRIFHNSNIALLSNYGPGGGIIGQSVRCVKD